ncbi:MAG TPA: FtsX-like permease family protein [Planctomycetaceae bacterium]|nr:FtsX-like permease family protein [Planctomycetaceae bacterium]
MSFVQSLTSSASRPVLIATGVALLLLISLFFMVQIPVQYLVRNLTVRWRTTAMTALAFVLVISLLTVMMAFVNGMYRLTQSSGRPGNVMLLADGATDESFSNLAILDIGDIENQPGILHENDKPLCSRETYLVVNQPLQNPLPGRPKSRFTQVRGLDDAEMGGRVHGLNLYPGGAWISPAGVREAAAAKDDATKNTTPKEATQPPEAKDASTQAALIEAVVGEGVARVLASDRPSGSSTALAKERLDVGDTFPLGGRTWVVTGVMQSAGSTFDSEIWTKRSIVGPMFGKESCTSVVVRAAGAKEARKLKDFFNTQYKKAALSAQVETEYFESLTGTNRQFLFAIGFVTVVMAIGGVMGVMNTMFAAVSNRVKDIGVLRLMGYSRLQVMLAFLLESLLIALVGGALGCALGYLADGWTASSIVSSAAGGGGKFVVLRLTVDLQTLLLGLLLALGMGLIGGAIPALSAVRLKPLEALR